MFVSILVQKLKDKTFIAQTIAPALGYAVLSEKPVVNIEQKYGSDIIYTPYQLSILESKVGICLTEVVNGKTK